MSLQQLRVRYFAGAAAAAGVFVAADGAAPPDAGADGAAGEFVVASGAAAAGFPDGAVAGLAAGASDAGAGPAWAAVWAEPFGLSDPPDPQAAPVRTRATARALRPRANRDDIASPPSTGD